MTYRSLSIKQKLRLIIMITVGAALVLSGLAMLAYDYVALRGDMQSELSVLAEIVGSNSTAALSFGDPKAAEEILSGLRAERHVVGACIYLPDRKPFAVYRRDAEASTFKAPALRSDGTWFHVCRRVLLRRIIVFG